MDTTRIEPTKAEQKRTQKAVELAHTLDEVTAILQRYKKSGYSVDLLMHFRNVDDSWQVEIKFSNGDGAEWPKSLVAALCDDAIVPLLETFGPQTIEEERRLWHLRHSRTSRRQAHKVWRKQCEWLKQRGDGARNAVK